MSAEPIFFFEHRPYSRQFLIGIVGEDYLDQLLKHKICAVSTKGKNNVIFEYVGFLVDNGRVIFVFPKYVDDSAAQEQLKEKMAMIARVLMKYGSLTVQEDNADFIAPVNDQTLSSVAIASFILEDFLQNGYYRRTENEYVLNGSDEILWSKTVEEIAPYLAGGRPVYFDAYHRSTKTDEYNMILAVHKWAVSYCYQHYAAFLGLPEIEIEQVYSDLDILGSKEFVLSRLHDELVQSYVDQKVLLLRMLIALISKDERAGVLEIDAYGTRHFEYVWQAVCSHAFDNEYKKYEPLMPKPKWINLGSGDVLYKKTFIPDIIKTYEDDTNKHFVICDAKYYYIRFKDNELNGNPGVNDVAKQLLYEQALSAYAAGYRRRNLFLFPADQEDVFDVFGTVNLDFMNLNPVYLLYLSDNELFRRFLSDQIFSVADMAEINEQCERRQLRGAL